MFDSVDELQRRLGLGEDSFFELKTVEFAGDRVKEPNPDSLSNELAAFANARGGVLLLGVDDRTRLAVGIPADRCDKLDQFVTNVCQTLVEPPLPVTTRWIELLNSSGTRCIVFRVDIDRSLFVHKSAGGYFHRVGSSKRPMSTDYLARMIQQRSQSRLIRFDGQIVPRARMEDLDPALCGRFRTDRSPDDQQDLHGKLGMAGVDDSSHWHPTVAGILMASRTPERWLPNAYVQAVAYRGSSVVPDSPSEFYQLDARDIVGPLDEQIMGACGFVARNMKVRATKDLGRHDVPQFDLTAIFEAVVNAVVHRDYAVYGSKIRLRMFSDRVELFSPGSIPNSMTVGNLPYRQAARNETITSLLARCVIPTGTEWLRTDRKTFMDRRGEGVPIILQRSEQLSGRLPEYRLIDDAELLLTIFAANP